jgi:hypothetical protein
VNTGRSTTNVAPFTYAGIFGAELSVPAVQVENVTDDQATKAKAAVFSL